MPFRRLLFLCPYSYCMKWNKDHFLSEYISIRTVCVWDGGVGGAVLFSVENRWCVKYDISKWKENQYNEYLKIFDVFLSKTIKNKSNIALGTANLL